MAKGEHNPFKMWLPVTLALLPLIWMILNFAYSLPSITTLRYIVQTVSNFALISLIGLFLGWGITELVRRERRYRNR